MDTSASDSAASSKDLNPRDEGKLEVKTLFSDFIPTASKITDQNLDAEGSQYLPCKRVVQYFFDGIDRLDHLSSDAPTDGTKAKWIMEDNI